MVACFCLIGLYAAGSKRVPFCGYYATVEEARATAKAFKGSGRLTAYIITKVESREVESENREQIAHLANQIHWGK